MRKCHAFITVAFYNEILQRPAIMIRLHRLLGSHTYRALCNGRRVFRLSVCRLSSVCPAWDLKN